jgi:hypothetical protein
MASDSFQTSVPEIILYEVWIISQSTSIEVHVHQKLIVSDQMALNELKL